METTNGESKLDSTPNPQLQQQLDSTGGSRASLAASDKETTPLISSLWWWQRVPKRHVVAIMAFLGFCNVYALRVNLSVAIVAMAQEFNWDSKQQGLVLGSFFWGYIVTQIPGGYVASRFGGRLLFGGGILLTALLTLLTPVAASYNLKMLVAVRITEGLFEGVTFPAMHAMWSKWAPPLEKTKLATTAWSGTFVGTVIALPLSGILAEHVSWQAVFFFFGSVAIVWFVAWWYIVRDSPDQHETISDAELDYLHTTVGLHPDQTKNMHTPWLSMMTSLPVWAIIVAHFCENWGFYTMLTELPTFLREGLNFQLDKAGVLAALPYAAVSITVPLGGQIADFIRKRGHMVTTHVRKMFTSIAFLSQALFMTLAALSPNATTAMTCIVLAVGLGGLSHSGFGVNHLDIAPQFAGVLMGISNCAATVPGIVSPTLTGHLTQHKIQEEWEIVFFISAGIYLVGSLFYALFASGERQKWAELPTGYSPFAETKSIDEIPFGN